MKSIIDRLDETLADIAALINSSRLECGEGCIDIIEDARNVVNRIRKYTRYAVISPATAISAAILAYRIDELAKALERASRKADAHNLIEAILAYLERIAKFVSIDYRKASLQLSMPIALLTMTLAYKLISGGSWAEASLFLGAVLSALLFARSPLTGLATSAPLAIAYAVLQLVVYKSDVVEVFVSWLLAIANLAYFLIAFSFARKGYIMRINELAEKVFRDLHRTSLGDSLPDLEELDDLSKYRLAILLMNGLSPEEALKLLNAKRSPWEKQFK